MFPLIERYLKSPTTQQAFCRAHGLPLSVFTYWLTKYRRETSQPGHEPDGVSVEIMPDGDGARSISSAREERPFLEMVYARGVRLRLFTPVEPAYLERLVALGGRTA